MDEFWTNYEIKIPKNIWYCNDFFFFPPEPTETLIYLFQVPELLCKLHLIILSVCNADSVLFVYDHKEHYSSINALKMPFSIHFQEEDEELFVPYFGCTIKIISLNEWSEGVLSKKGFGKFHWQTSEAAYFSLRDWGQSQWSIQIYLS